MQGGGQWLGSGMPTRRKGLHREILLKMGWTRIREIRTCTLTLDIAASSLELCCFGIVRGVRQFRSVVELMTFSLLSEDCPNLLYWRLGMSIAR